MTEFDRFDRMTGLTGFDRFDSMTGLTGFIFRMDLQKLHGFQMLSEHFLTKDVFLTNVRVLISNMTIVF